MTEDKEPEQLRPDEVKLLRKVLERERVYQAAGKMFRWLAAALAIAGIILASFVSGYSWVVDFIKRTATP